jgi:hypothetical protein
MDNLELPPGFYWYKERSLMLRADRTVSQWARSLSLGYENLAIFYLDEPHISIWHRGIRGWDRIPWSGTEEEAKHYMINALYLGMLQIGPEGEEENA